MFLIPDLESKLDFHWFSKVALVENEKKEKRNQNLKENEA